MLYGPIDPNDRFRERRDTSRRRRRRRRAALVGVTLAGVLAFAAGWQLAGDRTTTPEAARPQTPTPKPVSGAQVTPLPVEIRGVHVTSALASLPGKLDEYVDLERFGLNTIELDVKDEGGEIGFVPNGVPLAQRSGAARGYYDPKAAAALMKRNDIYLIGRVVVFQDPYLARARPELAIKRPDGSTWTTSGGLAWVNPYDRRVWTYVVSVAAAAARAGFDEIMFDYVRFPSDGDLDSAVYPGKKAGPRGRVIADFVSYARSRLEPLGVRISTALFGLAATRDIGIGQVPKWIGEHVSTVSPMAYPALYGSGELGIASPVDAPGETVFRTLGHYHRQLKGSNVQLVPWVQDFSGYTPAQVRAQVEAARLQGAKGFLLWNPEGVYTASALAPPEGA